MSAVADTATPAKRETARRISRLYTKQGLVYVVGFGVQRAIHLALLPFYTHMIGAAGYGLLQLLSTYGQFLVALLQHGQTTAFVRLGFEVESEAELRRLQATVVWHLLFVATLVATLLALTGHWWAEWLAWGVPFWPFGALLVGHCVCAVFISLYDQHLAALQRAVDSSLLSVGRTLLMAVLVLALVVWLELGVLGKLIADAVTAFAGAVIALRALAPGHPRDISAAWRRRALGYGLPLLPHAFAGLVNSFIDRVMVHAFLGLSAVGVYSLASQLIANGVLLLTSFNRSFAPAFVETAREAQELERQGDSAAAAARLEGLSLACLRLFLVGVLIFAGLCTVLKELVGLLAPAAFEEAWRIGPLLGAGMMATALYHALNQALIFTAKGTRILPLITGCAALTNIAANWWLLPRYGLQGAALATFGSNLILPLGSALGARSVLRLPHKVWRWAVLGLSALVYLGCVAAVDHAAWQWWQGLGLKLALYLVLALVLAPVAELSLRHWLRRALTFRF